MIMSLVKRGDYLRRMVVLRLVEKVINVCAKSFSFTTSGRVIQCISRLFRKTLAEFYSSDSAIHLSEAIAHKSDEKFASRMIFNKLTSRYISHFMFDNKWEKTIALLNKHALLTDPSKKKAKLLLCTHTGDYWVTILSLAREYEGQGCDFIVPIVSEITERNALAYKKIEIPGVRVIFMNINEKGAMIKIARYLHDPLKIVAIFYDLPCYVGGILTGSVEPVSLFNRKAYMAIGIVKLAIRQDICIKLVACRYNEVSQRFDIRLSLVESRDKIAIQTEMTTFLERYIEETPWQWHFISTLDSYYHFPLILMHRKNVKEMHHLNLITKKYSPHYV